MESGKRIREANNFDLLRMVMAVAVFFVHTYELTGDSVFVVFAKFFSSSIAVNCFFIISGFLIFMSYENSSSLKSYIEKRLRRIAPAYITVVTFCAIGGLLLTEFSAKEYFSFELFKYYIVNILTLNFIEPTLPGVFNNNIHHAVNGALWTIKIEIMFYISVPIIAYFLRRYNKLVICTVIYILSASYYLILIGLHKETGVELYRQFSLLLPGSLSFFISGGLLYYYSDWFMGKKHLLGAIGVVGFILYKVTAIYFILPISLALIVVYVALGAFYGGNLAKYGDFSYGVYIWHYPVLQTIIATGLFVNPLQGFAVTFILVSILSFLSWHLIEKPTLKKSSHYIKVTEK